MNGEEILDFEGDESTSQGGGGLADDGAEPMAVGKLSKTAKKRARKRLEKLAAARTEAERHAVLLETVTKTKRSAGERLQVRKRKIKKNLKLANECDDVLTAATSEAEGANSGANLAEAAVASLMEDVAGSKQRVPTSAKAGQAPRGSPEERKRTIRIKLTDAAKKKGLASAAERAETAVAQATAAVKHAEEKLNSMPVTTAADVEIARLHDAAADKQLKNTMMQLELAKLQLALKNGTSDANVKSKAPMTEAVDAPAVRMPAATAAAAATMAQAGPSSVAATPMAPAAGHSYMAAALTGQTKAQLQAELAQAKDDLDKAHEALEQAQVQAAELQSKIEMFEGKAFLQALNKPAVFTGAKVIGKPSLSVRDWMLAVTDYTTSIGMHNDKKKVAIAESYLGGDAKRDWHTKRRVLQEEGTTITFEVFSKSVIDSWDPACSDVKARAQLETIKFKGNITIYVSMFDRICSFIPNMTADEKVHKFLYQIRKTHPVVADKLQTDPSTKKTWNDYHQLRQYALHAAATDAVNVPATQNGASHSSAAGKRKRAGVFADMQHTLDQLNKRRKSGENGNWPRGGGNGGNGPIRGHGAGSSGGGIGNGGSNGGWQQRHGVRQLTEFTNAKGEKFVRSSADMTKLHNRQPRLCACCLQPSSLRHYAATCTSGFKAVPSDW